MVADIANFHAAMNGSIAEDVRLLSSMLAKSVSVIEGPNQAQINECHTAIENMAQEINVASAVLTLMKKLRVELEKKEERRIVGSSAPDAAATLEVCAGFPINRKVALTNLVETVSSYPVCFSDKQKLRNQFSQLVPVLEKVHAEIMEIRQIVLHAHGITPRFRSTPENLKALVKAANNNNVRDQAEFEAV